MDVEIADGFTPTEGKRGPPDRGQKYWVQFRCGWLDKHGPYPVKGTRWIWGEEPDDWDIIAVKRA